MSPESFDKYVRCCFNREGDDKTDININLVSIYFAKTKDIISKYPRLIKFIDKDDRLRADKFHFEEDRCTWLFCHTLLRLVIASKLGIDSSEVIFFTDINNKPWLEGNPLFFNISHTREALAFAISDSAIVGIDIEKVDRKIDFESIIRTFFSPGERKFILTDPDLSREKLFLLWTRKEALLKALGTGIINKLTDVEVFREINILNSISFENIVDDHSFCDHYLYSKKILNHYLSLAVPSKAKISFHHLNSENVKTILSK